MPAATIDPLCQHPEHLPLVARWIYDEFWVGKPGYSPEFFEGLLRDARDPDRIPLSFLALVGEAPAGTVNLIQNDSPTRPHLYPWLAALVVVPEFRHRGIGTRLVGTVLENATRLGYRELFLGTDLPEFYERLGGTVHERVNETMRVMRFGLGSGP